MILRDQPTNFDDNLVVAVSSRADGTMLDRTSDTLHGSDIVSNREKFCAAAGVEYESCAYQKIIYDDSQSYDKIEQVYAPDTEDVAGDVLYTRSPNVGLFLPVADCVATVVFDPTTRSLALAHLGRHASIARTMTKALRYFEAQGSEMRNIQIWMAPNVHINDYRMEYFDHKDEKDWRDYCDVRPDGVYLDLAGFNTNLAVQAGVDRDSIVRSPINTASGDDYFSHSRGDISGRFAVVAMMR